jgi:exonuclease SbcC
VLITRLYLQNYRVYEDPLELELPPGLVGIYGPNGSGKSTLLEAILHTLWGRSRTPKDQIRSSGVGGDCVTEVEFTHEDHLYQVRRALRGINSQVSVEVRCDRQVVSTGSTRDAERFVESVLGLDDDAFRASVFAEQKQLAAFSSHKPAERRRLVLQLLGVTPLDAARDAARQDARQLAAEHDRVRGLLPDLDQLTVAAADADAAAGAAEARAADEEAAAQAARGRLDQAAAALDALDRRRQEHEALVAEGRAARQELDRLVEAARERAEELAELDALAAGLDDLERRAADVGPAEALVAALERALDACRRLESAAVGQPPPPPDEAAAAAAQSRADTLRQELAAARALLQAAEEEAERCQRVAERTGKLDASGECPTCGQALGPAFANVAAHHRAEAEQAEKRAAEARSKVAGLAGRCQEADAAALAAGRALDTARAARSDWEAADRRRAEALAAWDEAWAAAVATGAAPGSPTTADPARPAYIAALLERERLRLASARQAHTQAVAVRSRLPEREKLRERLAGLEEQRQAASGLVDSLRQKVKALGYDPEALQGAVADHQAASAAADRAATSARDAAVRAAAARQDATGAASRLEDGRALHAKLADLQSDVLHRGRAAELLAEFRNTVVASVGPRLALQAAALFHELTDHEYEKIEVDPDSYELQISDGGRLYGLDRFSGSEIDLANLALRVAISEHIHFQSGGAVGLLVLDEVFGPLDEDRKARMLQALERLKARFRQVLVVTHDNDIKEQLPNAIEVVKLPGRRATARVLCG